MEIWGAIATGLRGIVGAILPTIKKKYFDQPKVYIVFTFHQAMKIPRGLSPRNDRTRAIYVTEAIYFNELKWEQNMAFRNNSEHVAYNIKLLNPTIDNTFDVYPKIDNLKPLLSNTEISYVARFYALYEGRGIDANNLVSGLPPKLNSDNFILEYTNVKGTKFYTVYKNGEHKFLRKLK